MKTKKEFFILTILLNLNLSLQAQNDTASFRFEKTGIFLDSLGNEVLLVSDSVGPLYYYSYIFTPVCNTGECLPVKINLRWNLLGEFSVLEMPQGEILTKLNHIPFSSDDYQLLEEILHGPDPRLGSLPVSHGLDSDLKQNKGNQASPAPSSLSSSLISKYEMVDGKTGATIVRYESKFVPGALYTTYTIWGLAHDKQYAMYQYSTANLLTENYIMTFLSRPETGLQSFAMTHLIGYDQSKRAEIVISLVDTSDTAISLLALNYLYGADFENEVVIRTLDSIFFSQADLAIRQRILNLWTLNYIPEKIIRKIAQSWMNYPELKDAFFYFLVLKSYYLEPYLDEFLEQAQKLPDDDRKYWYNQIKSYYKTNFSKSGFKKIKKSLQ